MVGRAGCDGTSGAASAFQGLADEIANDGPNDEPAQYVTNTLLHLVGHREIIPPRGCKRCERRTDEPPDACERLRLVLHDRDRAPHIANAIDQRTGPSRTVDD
jgi:hypothetical protein